MAVLRSAKARKVIITIIVKLILVKNFMVISDKNFMLVKRAPRFMARIIAVMPVQRLEAILA